MPIPLGSQGQADFTQPIELLMDCHRRIEHFLDVLARVMKKYALTPLDQQGRDALETSLNYFKQAAPRHTADEEESLFPRMRKHEAEHVKEVMQRIDRLEADHRKAEAAHDVIDKLGRKWLEESKLNAEDRLLFDTTLAALTQDYQQHIELEDKQVFTLAADILDENSLANVGDEMRQRRQLNPGRPGSRCAHKRSQLLGTPSEQDQ